MDGCNNAALIIFDLANNGTMLSFVSKSLVKKLQLPLVSGQKLAVMLANC